AGAAAKVARDHFAHLFVRSVGHVLFLIEECGDRHEEPRGAEPALEAVAGLKRLLDGAQGAVIVCQVLDGPECLSVHLHSPRQATACRASVDVNGAGAADAVLATDMGAGEPEVMT